MNRVKGLLNLLLRISVSGVLLWYLFTKVIDIDKTLDLLKTADLVFVIYAFIIFLSIIFILLIRWFIYINALELSVDKRNVVRFYFAGLFGNLFLPSSIGGDFIKIMGLCSESNQKVRVIASVLLDRLSGFVAIVIVAVFSFIVGYNFIDDKLLAVPIGMLAAIMFCLGIVLFNERIYSFFCGVLNFLPKLKKKVMNLHYDINLMKGKKFAGYKAIFISCCAQIIFAFTFFLSSKALHQDINVVYFLIFVPLICIVSMVPSLGGLGAREAGSVYLFSKIGISPGIAASMSLLSFLFMVIVGLIGGLIYVFTLSSGRIQHQQSIAE